MYKYYKGNNWLVDDDGNIVCQFWNKFESDYLNSHENGIKVEAALNAVEAQVASTNSSSPKLPEFTKVYDAVKKWFDSAPDFARPCPADIVKVAYDFIAGNFGL